MAAERICDDEFLERRAFDARHRATRQHAVRDIGSDALGTRLLERGGGVAQRAARIDDIVDQDAEAAFDLTDDVHHFGFARALTPLVDDGERRIVESLGQRPRAHHAAHVGRNHHQIALAIARQNVGRHHWGREQIVGRDIEKALDLPGVQIDREHAVGPGNGDEIGDELGRNRRARPRLTILAGIAEIGDDGGDALGRGAFQRVDANQQLHQIVIRGIASRLQHEHVLAAHILADFHENFLIGEAADQRVGQRQFEIGRNIAREGQVRIAGHQFHGVRNSFWSPCPASGCAHCWLSVL